VKQRGDLADFFGKLRKFVGEDGLHAVRESLFGLVMNFDKEAVGADGDGGARKRQNFVAHAGAVTRVHDDGQMAAALDGGNDGEVERIAGMVGEGAHAALAENHVVVAFGEDVFGGHEEFVERGGHAALQEDGFFGVAGALEEREILHVARADLDDVGVLLDEVEAFVIDGFGDDAEAEVFSGFGEDLQAGLA